jgi:plasmid stabilization system protein ParE
LRGSCSTHLMIGLKCAKVWRLTRIDLRAGRRRSGGGSDIAFRVEISPRAFNDLDEIAEYIKQRSSFEQAEKWFNGIIAAIRTLEHSPHRCQVAEGIRRAWEGSTRFALRKAQPPIRGVLFGATDNALDRYRPRISCEALRTEKPGPRPTSETDQRSPHVNLKATSARNIL